jgi:hypothetical protein
MPRYFIATSLHDVGPDPGLVDIETCSAERRGPGSLSVADHTVLRVERGCVGGLRSGVDEACKGGLEVVDLTDEIPTRPSVSVGDGMVVTCRT